MATKQLIVIVSVLTMMAGCLSCGYFSNTVPVILELGAQKVTLEEASEITGRPVPVPTYLPNGCAIQEVYIYDHLVILLISDKEIEKELVWHTDAAGTRQRYEFECRMTMQIGWWEDTEPPPPRGLPGKWVDIGGSRGFIFDHGDYNDLMWRRVYPLQPGGCALVLSAGKRVSSSELVKIAESAQY